MTVPIVPGPFSFLSSAGAAAGDYGAVREERKRHGEEIAAAGAQSIMQQIMQGYKPASVLADPEVQSLFKKAYGVSIPGAVLPQPKELVQRKTAANLQAQPAGGASERAVTGVPSEAVAGAGEATQKLAGATAQSQLNAGLPDINAETQVAVAQAQREGAQLNVNIFRGARTLLGNDPKFARLAYEAATGALDARLRILEYSRGQLTLDRQLWADRTRILLDQGKEASKRYDDAKKQWDQQLQTYVLEKGDTPEIRSAFTEANPEPNPTEIADKYFKDVLGYGIEEYRQRLSRGIDVLNGVGGEDQGGQGAPKPIDKPGAQGTPTPGTAQPTGQPPAQPATTRVQQIMSNMVKMDPEASADQLADAVRDQKITQEEASVIAYQLRSTAPADWFRKFTRTYTASSLRGTSIEPTR